MKGERGPRKWVSGRWFSDVFCLIWFIFFRFFVIWAWETGYIHLAATGWGNEVREEETEETVGGKRVGRKEGGISLGYPLSLFYIVLQESLYLGQFCFSLGS